MLHQQSHGALFCAPLQYLTKEHKQAKLFNECYLHEVWLDPLWYTLGFQYSWSYTGIERHVTDKTKKSQEVGKKTWGPFLHPASVKFIAEGTK